MSEAGPGRDLGALTRETFLPVVGDIFLMHVPDGPTVAVKLVEATALGPETSGSTEERRRPFSLVFRGPPELRAPQAIHRLDHETLGSMEIFLVPIGPDEAGTRYEAVFN